MSWKTGTSKQLQTLIQMIYIYKECNERDEEAKEIFRIHQNNFEEYLSESLVAHKRNKCTITSLSLLSIRCF